MIESAPERKVLKDLFLCALSLGIQWHMMFNECLMDGGIEVVAIWKWELKESV
jgi:hypothetical protein